MQVSNGVLVITSEHRDFYDTWCRIINSKAVKQLEYIPDYEECYHLWQKYQCTELVILTLEFSSSWKNVNFGINWNFTDFCFVNYNRDLLNAWLLNIGLKARQHSNTHVYEYFAQDDDNWDLYEPLQVVLSRFSKLYQGLKVANYVKFTRWRNHPFFTIYLEDLNEEYQFYCSLDIHSYFVIFP